MYQFVAVMYASSRQLFTSLRTWIRFVFLSESICQSGPVLAWVPLGLRLSVGLNGCRFSLTPRTHSLRSVPLELNQASLFTSLSQDVCVCVRACILNPSRDIFRRGRNL